MKILLRKTHTGFEPDSDLDKERCSKIGFGNIVQAEIKQPRNIQFHRKYFALLNLAFQNQDKYEVFEDFRIEVQLKCGHYQEHITTKGQIVYVPKSVSFSSMDELQFGVLYEKAIDIILKHFLMGSTKEEIDKQVLQILDFS